MLISWHEDAWKDYLYWQKQDKSIVKKINLLIRDIERAPFAGKGKPEMLKHNWVGFYSRRINREHRLVYKILENQIIIAQCRYHY